MSGITWGDLFSQGTLIKYSVHLWRARIQLKPEDLGIDQTEDIQKALSFGCHRLAPAEAFDEINTAVNGWKRDIEDHSLSFPLLEGVRYVPDKEVKTLQQKLDGWVRKFNHAVENFIAQYDEMMGSMLPVIEQALNAAAKTPEAAVAALSRVTREYPPAEKIRTKFGIEWDFFTITLPSSTQAARTAKASAPQIQKVVSSMIEELRMELATKVNTLLTLAQKAKDGTSRSREGLGEKSRKSALIVLEKVERLNILGDPIIAEQTRVLRQLLESTDGESDFNRVIRDLNQVQSTLETDIQTAAAAAEKKLTGLGNRKLRI